MTRLERWLRFNAVGAGGFVLQLALLYFFVHRLRWSAGLAATAAVESTLLCTFTLHRRFVWRDERSAPRIWRALLRFHLSNGAVSLAGNAVLTPLLLRCGLPLLVANAGAVAACSLLNFALAAAWVFPPQQPVLLPSSVRVLQVQGATATPKPVDFHRGCAPTLQELRAAPRTGARRSATR